MAKKSSTKRTPNFVVGDSNIPWGGLNTIVKDNRFLNPGESYDQENWITGRDKDHIELRRGSIILGDTKRNIAGAQVRGIGIGIKNEGTQVPFFKFNQKVFYYDQITNDTIEIGTDILPINAINDDFNFMPYQNLAGSFLYATSRNSGMYKFSVANLGSYLNLLVPDFHFNFAKINRGYMFGMNRLGSSPDSNDTTGLYLSVPDSIANNSNVLTFTVGSGDGVTRTFTGTISLSFPNTAYFVRIGDEIETFTDNKNGHLIGSLGGTGTIDYITGDYSVTFNTAPAIPVTYTATTISFTSATKTINDSASSLPIFLVGTLFEVSGSSSNNKIFTVISSTASDLVTKENLVDEVAGMSVTISQPILGTYQEENSTSGGVTDFSGNGSDTFRQDDGGGIAQAVFPFNGVEYCFHQLRSWLLTIDLSSGRPNFDNEPYYEQIGIPNSRAVFPTGDGIIFLNNAIPTNPKVSILEIPPGSTVITVEPVSVSDSLDLSQYGIDDCVIFRWNDWDFVSLKGNVNGGINQFNGITFIRNIVSGLWNKLGNFYIQNGIDFEGTLIAGSSIGANVMKLFQGFSDSNTVIPNYHNQAFTDLEIQGIKQVGYLNLSGLIQAGQKLDVFISVDNSDYMKVFTITGGGPYVSSQVVAVGTQGIGIGVVGGGFDGPPEYAARYEVDIPVYYPNFEYISWRVQATGNGYVSVERQEWKDIRIKRIRLFSYNDQEIDS